MSTKAEENILTLIQTRNEINVVYNRITEVTLLGK